MVLTQETKNILEKRIGKNKVKHKYHGFKAVNKISELFYPNDKKKAIQWQNRWNDNEKKRAIYVSYYRKNRTAVIFIIGEGKRLSVLGQRNITNKTKTKKNNKTRKK